MLKYDIVNALPYDIIRRIRQTFPSSDDGNDGKDSTYLYSKGNKCEIRISNHCTHLWTWHERKFGNNDDITRISIVFEQSDTFENKNLILRRHRKTPLRVMEFVYQISDPQSFTSKDVKIVIDTIKHCLKNQTIFKDVTGKLIVNRIVSQLVYSSLIKIFKNRCELFNLPAVDVARRSRCYFFL